MAPESRKKCLAKEQLLCFLDTMSTVFEQSEAKRRVADAANAGNAAAVSTEIQREVFINMGVDPQVGLDSLANVRALYHDDRECILKHLEFIQREESARELAEMGQEAFQQKRQQTKQVEEQQLKLLHQLRKLPVDVQEGFLQGLSSKAQGISASSFFNCVPTEETDPSKKLEMVPPILEKLI
ncbi:unnamed protein product [Calypogeia fissa]